MPSDDTKFKKGQSGNPKGRPKRSLTTMLLEAKKQGFEEVSREDIMAYVRVCLSKDSDELKEAMKEKRPIAAQLGEQMISNALKGNLSEKRVFFDMVFGKPKEDESDIFVFSTNINTEAIK